MSAIWGFLVEQPAHRRRIVGKEMVSAGQSPGEKNGRQKYDRRLLLVMTFVEQNLQRDVAIRELAQAVNLSPGRLAHLFKSEVGISLQRYLNNIRMERSKDLLGNGVLSVKEIAAEVGIPNSSRFCRRFRAHYGMTPKEYRQTHLRIDLGSIASAAVS